MIKILTVCPNPPDAASFYRGYGPLNDLMKNHGDVFIENGEGKVFDWSNMSRYNILFLQRPFLEQHAAMAEFAKRFNIKVWLDHDDNVLDVPKDNPANKHYDKEKVRANIKLCLQYADLITVSTPFLKQLFEGYGGNNIHVVPNALNTDFFGNMNQPKLNNIVLWRGSNTHFMDYKTVADTINKMAFRGHNLYIIGGECKDKHNDVRNLIRREYMHQPAIDVIKYHRLIRDLRPRFIFVPLVINDFNRGKSNIAWMEAAWAGGATLATYMDEWIRPGITNYYDTEDFKEKFELLLTNDEYLIEKVKESQRHIKKHLTLNKTNRLRYKLLRSIL